ncbi:hypothetical protein E1A91_D11G248300v1 [Gossypium mustelinum]|uniref:BZIP domain-containing protein n=2 Tax=Gossypium mustelinum TaxID=34275 RepID=A0A5D2SX16_GOSMU|nr:hypothetical protein E1A91_D11G248300v1 [Gossypium mustelinum]TYI56960.1 hypothetical protein E1A91_D11G248300v1 [Gossypium mustelinum]TYI56963.1 hypothetical protein E1A91_D11G248300v1 [Gossypium mustelinum]
MEESKLSIALDINSTCAKVAFVIISKSMNSPTPQFVPSRLSIYEPIHQIGIWGENFKRNGNPNTSTSLIVEVDNKLENESETTSHEMLAPTNNYEQEASKPIDKIQRRLAQNREAARKSRLRKKAYVQQLENSRLKLIQLEQELQRVTQQGLYMGGVSEGSHIGFSGTVTSGIAAFEMEYGRWVDVQHRQICELRTALNAHISDIELRILVKSGLLRERAYSSGSNCKFFLQVLVPQLDPLTEQQILEVCNLKQSCQQAEDALSQGMEKLQETVSSTVAGGPVAEDSYIPQVATAMEKLEALVSFVNQADHLRQETLQQMSRILTTRQAARGLLALGEYFHRLRALSTLWATRPPEPSLP